MFTKQVLAVNLSDIYGPGGALEAAAPGGVKISTLVNPIIANVLIISGVVAFFTVFLAGFNYITAGGDKTKTEQSQQMLNYGILGIIVVVAAYLITRLIGLQIGFKFF